jgi:hypothetical protein
VTLDPLEHEVTLSLASGATLKLLYFSDREQRWIFSYDYFGEKHLRPAPEIVNKTKLTVNYEAGVLASPLLLSMHIIVPERLGQKFFAGMDISPGAKTYLEFTYERDVLPSVVGGAERSVSYRLVEICKGARERVRLADVDPGLIRPIEFPFPVPDRIGVDFGVLRVPFRTNAGSTAFFDFPERTLR